MKVATLTTLLFLSFFVSSQTELFPCKTDEMHQELFLQHPEYNQGIVNAYNRLQDDTRLFLQNGNSKSDALYVIPVVFHIIHNNGAENISDAQIHDALKQVNIQFRKQNADTNEIVAQFKPIAADIEIEFRLAQLDPEGNCTSGITRTVSSLTSPGNHDVKSLIHWPPNKYLNIYVCAQAATLAGHALLPSAADTIPQWDGIVMQHSYVGTIGTSEYFRRTVLTHEIGHYLNLQHIWGGNNVPNYYYLPVAQSANCAHDDDVTDTPNTIGWQSCNLGGTTCDSDVDNVQNYMDYAYCGRMFTEGQKARMHACLNSSVANRNNLWQPQNLIDTGTDDGTYYLCGAKFESDKRIVCIGDTVEFFDMSYHGIQTREWDFYGGNATSTVDSTVKVVYENPGYYDVKLTVERNSQQLEILLENYITVLPSIGLPDFFVETYEDTASIQSVVVDNSTPYNWELTTSAGFNSNQSFYVNNFESSGNITSDFYLSPVDISHLTSAVISFDVAYAQRIASNNDLLQIYISTDCGNTWSIRRTLNGMSSLKTVTTPVATSFFPASSDEWKNQLVVLSGASTFVENLMVRFSFKSAGGNNVFVDNIQVTHPDQLSAKQIGNNQLVVYPNPSERNVFISSEQEQIEEIEVYSLDGKKIFQEKDINQTMYELTTSFIQNGMYVIKIRTENGEYQHVQVIQK